MFFVGWGFSSAVTQWQAELGDAWGADGLPFTFFFALLFSAFAVAAVLVLQPMSRELQFGDGPIVDWFEDLVEDVAAMGVRAFSVSIMVLWYNTASGAGLGAVEDVRRRRKAAAKRPMVPESGTRDLRDPVYR